MAAKREKVTVEVIEKKLTSFNSTQDSVQATSLWIMHNKSQHQKIVDTWLKVLKASSKKHQLTLFYLCNDVVQHAKKKKALYYLENFKDNLREAVHVVKEQTSIKPNISRIFKIWEERRTYDAKFISELRKILENEVSVGGDITRGGDSSRESSSANVTPKTPVMVSPAYKPSPKVEPTEDMNTEKVAPSTAEFKPTVFVEELSTLRKMESEVSLKTKQLASLRIDATNIEAIRQLKDRSHGNEFCKQFEESCKKIEDYVSNLEKEIGQARHVLSFCDAAEIFYDEQYKEAKIVANAYKNFGARVTNMKKRVDDMKKIIPATPSPVPSPSADAPSPGNTPPLQDMDDNDMVDMDLCEDEAEPSKLLESGSFMPQRVAYTAMVKSIAQPIPSVTNIVIGDKDAAVDSLSEDEVITKPKSATDTFQGTNILENRIASMLPNLAKGNSSVGLGITNAPVPTKTLDDYIPAKSSHQEDHYENNSKNRHSNNRDSHSNHSTSKSSRHDSSRHDHDSWRDSKSKHSNHDSKHSSRHNDSSRHSDLSRYGDKGRQGDQSRHGEHRRESSSEAQNDSDDRSSTPVLDEPEDKDPEPPKSSRSSSKPAAAKVKTNPIDFLSQLLTKSNNTSSSSNFLQSLSLLTNTAKKKKEEEEKVPGSQQPEGTNPVPADVAQVVPGVPGLGVGVPTSVPPPEPMSQSSSWPNWKPVVPPPQPPLPKGPEPTTSPTLPPTSAADRPPQPPPPQHPPLPPEPILPVHQPIYPMQPPPQQDFSLPPPVGPKFPTSPPVSQSYRPPVPPSQPQPFNMPPPPSSQSSFQSVSSSQNFPPPNNNVISPSRAFPMQPPASVTSQPGLISPHMMTNPSGFPFPGVRPPIHGVNPPAPAQPSFPSHSLDTAQRLQGPWGQQDPTPHGQPPPAHYGTQMSNNSDRDAWNQERPLDDMESEGYVHPWDQPHAYDEEEEEEEDIVSDNHGPPPKGILRNNRSSSLREVTLVDEKISSSQAPVQREFMSAGILKKPKHYDTHNESVNDVQSEFIAKLKQKGHSNIDVPPPHHPSISGSVSHSGHGEAISTIGVIGQSGRTASDDMDMDLDEMDSNSLIELGSREPWQAPVQQDGSWQKDTGDSWHQDSNKWQQEGDSWKQESKTWQQEEKTWQEEEQWQQEQDTWQQQEEQKGDDGGKVDSWQEEDKHHGRAGTYGQTHTERDARHGGGHGDMPGPPHQHPNHHNFVGSGPRGMGPQPFGRGGVAGPGNGGQFDSFRPRGPHKPWSRPQHFDQFHGPSPAKRPFFSPRQRMPYYRF